MYTASGLTGVIAIEAKVDFVAGAQAWVDGPSGVRLSLASASVLGDGDLAANITINIDVNTGTIDATLVITRSDINPHWDVHTPFGWPLDAIAAEVLNHISRDEASKLARMTARLGRWNILGLPTQYLSSFTHGDAAVGYSEGLDGVSAVIGVGRRKKG